MPLDVRTSRKGRHWIVGPELGLPCGPYSTKAEAREDARGLERYFDAERKGRLREHLTSKPQNTQTELF